MFDRLYSCVILFSKKKKRIYSFLVTCQCAEEVYVYKLETKHYCKIDRFLVVFGSSVYTMLFIKFSFREIWVIHLLRGEFRIRLCASLFQISRAQCTCWKYRQWRWRVRNSIPGQASDRKVIILQSVKLTGHHSHKIHLIPSQVL